MVRVGDEAEETGMLGGFNDNPHCATMTEELVLSRPKLVSCRRPIAGRYVSIRVVDYVEPTQLKLCNVDVITEWNTVDLVITASPE